MSSDLEDERRWTSWPKQCKMAVQRLACISSVVGFIGVTMGFSLPLSYINLPELSSDDTHRANIEVSFEILVANPKK